MTETPSVNPSTIPPSQLVYPKRAVMRTIVAVIITSVAVINAAVPIIASSLPASDYIWFNSIAVAIAAVSGVITRIMAIPQVNEWLKSLNLSATPTNK